MTQTYKWYGEWRNTQIACPSCGWAGVLEQKAVEAHRDLADFSCPNCDEVLAIIMFPTRSEIEKNWDKLTSDEKNLYSIRFKFEDECQGADLASPDQLPDIDSDSVLLVWDCEEKEKDASGRPRVYLTIKHEGRRIWQEPAYYECVDRFDQVVDILKKKYGDRLKDLIPSTASKTYLGGDDLLAWDKLKKIRSRMAPASIDGEARRNALASAGDLHALNELRCRREFAAHHLEGAAQLPEITERQIVLTWDIAEDPPRVSAVSDGGGISFQWDRNFSDGFLYLTLSHGEQVVWKEAASMREVGDGGMYHDYAERYAEIVGILRSKYGDRLWDLVPTDRSFAYGWDMDEEIEAVRQALFFEN